MFDLVLYSLIGGLFSLIGGGLLLWRADFAKKIMLTLIAFAGGAFLSASLLDILPEAIEAVEEPHTIMLWLVGGFVAYFTFERFLMRYLHCGHEEGKHAEHTENLSTLVVTGDAIHNFLDGIVIGLAYLANPGLGLVTALAVAAHEIPQEIGDFSILLNQGWKKSRILFVNIAFSLLTVVGALIGYSLGNSVEAFLPYLLAATSGIFLYIAASDLIPELHHQAGHKYIWRVVLPLILGIIAVSTLVNFTHNSEVVEHSADEIHIDAE